MAAIVVVVVVDIISVIVVVTFTATVLACYTTPSGDVVVGKMYATRSSSARGRCYRDGCVAESGAVQG